MWRTSPTQLVRESAKESALLNLLFANREGLVGDVIAGGCLGHSNHEMVDFSLVGEAKVGRGGQQNFHLGLPLGRL